MLYIDDLPDFVLVEILCRLPRESAVQCRCVSKRWFSLLSDNYFRLCFLCVQDKKQTPEPTTLIFTNPKDARDFFTMSEQPLVAENQGRPRSFSLSFLPCFQRPVDTPDKEPIVVAACRDLVLCCAAKTSSDYYVCNPSTKQWDAIPSLSHQCCHEEAWVGFICEPYYYKKECREDGNDSRKEKSNTFQLNVESRYRIVRFTHSSLPQPSKIKLEIFTSKTGKWTEHIASGFSLGGLNRTAVAYKGNLYWWNFNAGWAMGLDIEHLKLRCIRGPQDDQFITPIHSYFEILESIKARSRKGYCMRTCQFSQNQNRPIFLSVWEYLEDEEANNAGKYWYLVGRVSLDWMKSQNPLAMESKEKKVRTLGFDPNNEDILYVQVCGYVVIYNIGAKTVKVVWKTELTYDHVVYRRVVFPYMHPWWPTTLPKRKQLRETSRRPSSNRDDETQRRSQELLGSSLQTFK
ncbi:unnamed protein product [Malus baccata var. baccata]